MYREYRDRTVSAGVTQCYRDMGARHRARAHSIQVFSFDLFSPVQVHKIGVIKYHAQSEVICKNIKSAGRLR